MQSEEEKEGYRAISIPMYVVWDLSLVRHHLGQRSTQGAFVAPAELVGLWQIVDRTVQLMESVITNERLLEDEDGIQDRED